ncbi:Uncharacterised protein [Mycobacterium xenopi]|uniref:Uncharacterized protein n=1 Tax=Mycobacterium xenopi TaxID=1789 RepID=A0AAD1M2C5_MYCXE|nr:hypothetical protein MYXE_38290 [Mycobacterium xenopi]SPX90859.1 Uncharacterised protein [Mycobacterium xenopi]
MPPEIFIGIGQHLSLNPWMGDFVLPSTRLFWDAAECGAVGRG